MSYAVYKSDAIILRILPHGEHNRDVVFFARELGKIQARVQAGRKAESKMRMQLTRYHHVAIDVVRGRAVWRLTGITEIAPHRLFQNQGILRAWNRAVGLAEHLIRGEESQPELFDFLVGVLEWIDTVLTPDLSPLSWREGPNVASGLELFLVIHVLEKMGYWSGEALPEIPTQEILVSLFENKKDIVKNINEAIEATMIV